MFPLLEKHAGIGTSVGNIFKNPAVQKFTHNTGLMTLGGAALGGIAGAAVNPDNRAMGAMTGAIGLGQLGHVASHSLKF